MARQDSPAERSAGTTTPRGDPWNAFGYLVSGVVVYGAAGWGLDHWLGTSFLVAVGIIVGAALGTYQTWRRFQIIEESPVAASPDPAPATEAGPEPEDKA